jgi:hypothetical protein
MRAGWTRRLILALAATAALLLALRPPVHHHEDGGSHRTGCAVCAQLASPTVLPEAAPAPVAPVQVRCGLVSVGHDLAAGHETSIPRSRGPPAPAA